MADPQSTGLLNLENELTCSICTDVLYQPLTLLDCLHTFCGSCLKEWFTSQASSSSDAHAPTCPQCRAPVRETRPNATVTTLLDMFLHANPNQRKSEAEKEALAKVYKPGDNVLPKVKRRRENPAEAEDRRLLEEVRERSLRDVENDARSRRRARERRSRSQETSRPAATSDPGSRRLEHQSSLVSLLSNSTDDNQMAEEILRQIREEGLLDGVNLDDIDVAQEDELSERIAEAYRRRHLRSSDGQHGRRSHSANTRSSRTPEGRSSRRPHERNHSAQGRSAEPRHPPVSRPHLLPDQSPRSRHHRSSSDQGRRQTSPASSTSRSNNPPAQATRSATDLSSTTSSAPGPRPRQLSDASRRVTDPQTQRITDTWSQIQRREAFRQAEPEGSRMTSSPTSEETRHNTRSSAPTTPRQSETRVSTTEHVARSRGCSETRPRPEAPNGRHISNTALPQQRNTLYAEPTISCDRCGKTDIQYETHKNCSRCANGKYNLCMRCFRDGKGCLHWFGFGHKALVNYHNKHPIERGHDRPHILSGRRYLPPREGSIRTASPSNKRLTSDDPSKRLQSGMFCDICLSFANNCYWKCDTCNEGEWGFCNKCVDTGRCCTHPLLPLTDESNAEPLPNGASILDTPTTPDFGDYSPLTFSTKCNLCSYPIPPSTTRFHCSECHSGEYNLHDTCYLKLVAGGIVSKDNGPNGWRRCPQNGHRMIVFGFEDYPEGQKRTITRHLVGGYGLDDSKMSPTGVTPHWRWEGVDGQRRTRLISRDISSSTNISPHDSAITVTGKTFPPDGGEGMVAVAIWGYFPDTAGPKDLAFPKWAEIREVEDINGDWYSGVYAGSKGVFPGNFVKLVHDG